jgi:hypothetical protein
MKMTKQRSFQPNDYIDTQRQPERWAFRFTDREKLILERLYLHGILSEDQVQALFFGSFRNAQKRMMKLFHHGYVNRVNERGKSRYKRKIYWLSERGAVELGLEERYKTPSWGQVEHDLLVTDFTLKLEKACRATEGFLLDHSVSETEFRVSPDKVQYTRMDGKREEKKVIPDAFFHVTKDEGGKAFHSRLLLELDHSTHSNTRFADEKVLAGLAYIRSDAYQFRFGTGGKRREDRVGGRWLIVTTGDENRRLKYLKDITERVAGEDAKIFYFTRFADVMADNILTGKIWLKAGQNEKVSLF